MNALITLVALSVIILVSEMLNFKKILLPIVLIGLAVAFGFNILDWGHGVAVYNNMLNFDNYSFGFSSLIIAIAFLWFIHSADYFIDREDTKSDKYALIVFALIGSILLSSYSHMVMLFLGIEILSIPMYILAGSRKDDPSSNEAAMKYFLMGSFASAFLLFGIALIYGATGSFHITGIANYISGPAPIQSIFYLGVTLMMIGLAFKVSAVPFHFWTPDVYQGAPTIVTTFMATIVKTAAFAAFYRLFFTTFGTLSSTLVLILSVMAALTILAGNLTAAYQTSVKRMLAYSSVAHAGYMLIAFVSMNSLSASSILFYTAAYSVSTIASFSVLYWVIKQKGVDNIEAFRGLSKSNPLLAFITVVSMLSLAGIPPTAGFFAKYYIFTAALQENHLILVLIAVLGSLIGVYYYFKVIIAVFTPVESEKVQTSGLVNVLMIACALIIIFLGLFPNMLIGII